MMQKMIVRKMNTGGLFQPDMLLQMMQKRRNAPRIYL